MSVMIKLKLEPVETFQEVAGWSEFRNVALDEKFGIVCIKPSEHLFVVRADKFEDVELKRKSNPKILGTTCTGIDHLCPDHFSFYAMAGKGL